MKKLVLGEEVGIGEWEQKEEWCILLFNS